MHRWLNGETSPTWQNVRDVAVALGADPQDVLAEVGYTVQTTGHEPSRAEVARQEALNRFGPWLRANRLASRRLTPKALANATGLPAAAITRWETGQGLPTINEAFQLARGLDGITPAVALVVSGHIVLPPELLDAAFAQDPIQPERSRETVRDLIEESRDAM